MSETRTPLPQPQSSAGDTLQAHFLAEDAQPALAVAERLAAYIDAAQRSLDIAIYDCRLEPATAQPIRDALHRKLQAGVRIRVIYDRGDDKPQTGEDLSECGTDLGEPCTDERVSELGLPDEVCRPAHGYAALMHQKYLVRDGRDIWTGSVNWTDDSFRRMENTIVTLTSPELAAHYTLDFQQIWEDGRLENSGKFDTTSRQLTFAGYDATTGVAFSPGRGEEINDWVARQVRTAQRRIVINTMLISSSRILRAFEEQLDRGAITVSGVYDRTQTESVLYQWEQEGERLQWKRDALERLIREGKLIGKRSIPYRPGGSHNFMHNKTMVIDDMVLTGSYNFSHSARENAENMLAIHSPVLAGAFIEYTNTLAERFAFDAASHGGRPS